MKKVLSLLVAFVFMQEQTWALSGGPVYGGSQAAVSGTYAGVFTGISGTAVDLGLGLVDPLGTNAVGLFVIGVPVTDLATGTSAIFIEGTFFQGGILGIADPNKQTLTGVAQAVHITQLTSFTDLFFGQSSKSVNFDATADGTIKGKIEKGDNSSGTTLIGTGNFAVSRILSQLVTFPDPNTPGQFITRVVQTSVPEGSLSFLMDGFKQSATVTKPAADSIATLLNGQGTTGQ